MDWYRFIHTIGLCLKSSGQARAKYIKKHNVFYHMGDNCMVMFRKIPLYPKLISFGDNVWIASNVQFVTHDVIHKMLNNRSNNNEFLEYLGCIDIQDNVFVGANTTILPNVLIGPNTIIAAGSIVNKDIQGNGVYGGVPARYICSIDDLIEKRRVYSQNIKNDYGLSSVSDQLINKIWEKNNSIK